MSKLLIKDLKCLPKECHTSLEREFNRGWNSAIDSIGEVDIREFVDLCDCIKTNSGQTYPVCADCNGSGIVARKG